MLNHKGWQTPKLRINRLIMLDGHLQARQPESGEKVRVSDVLSPDSLTFSSGFLSCFTSIFFLVNP